MNHWHQIAREMVKRGEPRCEIARVFNVSEAMVSKIARASPPRGIKVPPWVAPHNRRSFRILAQERGIRIAIAWAEKVQGT